MATMRLLRSAGIAHYGTDIEVFPVSPRALLRLVPEFTAHTIVAGEGG